jgi:hypothetical protein
LAAEWSAATWCTMDAMAVVYARELSRWGIETSIIVPGAFTGGTNHFVRSGSPLDEARVAEYEAGPYKGFGAQIRNAFAAIVPPEADASSVADAIVRVVDTPFGKWPFRVHILTRPKMAPMLRSLSSTASATRCCIVSDFPICSSRGPTAEVFKSAARDARKLAASMRA